MTRDKEARISRANERAARAAEEKLSPQQKLERLDTKFGKGLGATKERAKLSALLNKTPAVKKSDVVDLAAATLPDSVLSEIEELNKPKEKKPRIKKNK